VTLNCLKKEVAVKYNESPEVCESRWIRVSRGIWVQFWGTLIVVMMFCASNTAAAQSLVALRGATIETVAAAGRLENATILVEDGKIIAVGTEIEIPDRAEVLDMRGKTIIPGIVDPYFVVDFPIGGPAPETRTVQFGGRSFNLPDTNSAPAVFVKIADVFDARRGDWQVAVRSGITTANIVSSGYGQSVIGTPRPQTDVATTIHSSPDSGNHPTSLIREPNGVLFAAVTNQPDSLRIIKEGLAEPRASGDTSGAGSSRGGMTGGEGRGRFGGRRGGGGGGGPPAEGTPPAGGAPVANNPSSGTQTPPARNPVDELWKAVREGQRPVFLNANNAAALLYLTQEAAKATKAKLALVASGTEVNEVLPAIKQNKTLTVILRPRLDTVANSQIRLNAPQVLEQNKVPFAFSLSLGQTDYRTTQSNPLFPVAMLVKSGLSREAALRALTVEPARILGLEQELGTIEPGRRADFVVFDSDPMLATAEIVEVWSAGKPLSGN
jgi:hypothetical protein